MIDRPSPCANGMHRVVYRDERMISSHPFLGGLWRVANGDLIVGFMQAECAYNSHEDVDHDRVTIAKRRMCTLRSTDNGKSWDEKTLQTVFETPEPEADPSLHLVNEPPFDPDSADTIIATGSSPALLVPDARPWMRISTDGGMSWRPVLKLPMAHLASLSGHGAAMQRHDGMWIVGLTAASTSGWRRRPALYGSWDGLDWTFLSFITPPAWDDEMDAPHSGTPRFWSHRYMYPRPIILRDGRILVSVRAQRDPTGAMWTEVFESADGGRTFNYLSRVNDWGAPGDIVEMADGRIACVYGYRLRPYGIRYSMSEDGGRTWTKETILREDGGSWDLGYPRVIEHKKGHLLAIYYMNTAHDPIQANGGVRHIASTEFIP